MFSVPARMSKQLIQNSTKSIHFGEDKTKCILFGTTKRLKQDNNLDIRYSTVHIKQYHTVTYLGCVLDENLSGEPMALQVIKKINTRLRFLYRKNRFLFQTLCKLLCNAIMQPHFDYACSAWYPNLNKSLKKKATNTPEQMYSVLFEFE